MAGEEGSVAEPATSAATVHVRCSNGSKFTVCVDLTSTVAALKQLLAERSEVPADQQRLIYKGRVLKDDNSLESYGLQNDHTLHLVRGAAPSNTTPSSPAPTPAPVSNGPTAGVGGLLTTTPALGSGVGGFPEFQQVQQQLLQNPNLMREMMNMPAIQSLMNNPDLMRTLIMNNPQMRDIMDRNPDLAHILNDPATLRQTLDAARNPELMREMMRHTDRAMSNIEASPEGFNMLRRMYETVQEPLLNAAAMAPEGTDQANPFAALLGARTAAANTTPSQTNTQTNTGAGAGPVLPNTAPLPNPWNPTAAGVGDAVPQPGTTPAGGGLLGLGLGGGFGDGLGFEQMLQNPAVMQAMQSLLSNPQYVNQMLNMHPQLRNIINANPQFREVIQNPEFLRQITNPETMQQLLAVQQQLIGQLGRQQPGLDQGGLPGGNLDINSLLGMIGGLGGNVPEVNVLPPEQLYATQLSQLQDMGFFDTQENIRALTATGGNVHAAVERLLGNP